jgi:hypothetical protein
MEYRIPWTDFNLTGNVITAAPADGAEWGIQICYTNDNLASSNYNTWEPTTSTTYVNSVPAGTWIFTAEGSDVDSWDLYFE